MNTQGTKNQGTELAQHPRRSFLRMATAAAAGCVALLQPSQVNAASNNAPNAGAERGALSTELEGTWLETVTFHGDNLPPQVQAPFPTFITFARGGGLITIAGNTAPARGNMSFGSWKKTGPREYSYTFMGFFYSDQGALDSYVKANETLRFEKDGDQYNGAATVQLLDTNLNVLGELKATTVATRIGVE